MISNSVLLIHRTRSPFPMGEGLVCADSSASALTKDNHPTRRGDHNSAALRVTNKFVLSVRSGVKQLTQGFLREEGGIFARK